MAAQEMSGFEKTFDLKTGMNVHSNDGKKLGTITELQSDYFVIQKGFFFPRDFTLRYDDIRDISDENVNLKLSESELIDWRNESYQGWEEAENINQGKMHSQAEEEFKSRSPKWEKEEIKIPAIEEELKATKVQKQVGEVKVRKIAHTELRHFKVPVTHEEVHVERVQGSEKGTEKGEKQAEIMTGASSEQSIPVMAEEVTISKRPVVKEEVRIVKEKVVKDKDIQGEVRKEEIKIEGEDKLKKRKAG